MQRRFGGKTVRCPSCGWVGQSVELGSMAGFVFCPNCHHRRVGYFPLASPECAPDKEDTMDRQSDDTRKGS